jgi:hypothetical protein
MDVDPRTCTPTEMTQLAALSRTYREALHNINRAVMQELSADLAPERRAEGALKFGLTEDDLPRYLPGGVLRVHKGSLHRANMPEGDI